MAKYNVTHACGCKVDHQIAGPVSGRQNRADWLAAQQCYQCQQGKAAPVAGMTDEITMTYSEYKNKYSNCRTVSGSYNAKKKTITVIVPKGHSSAAQAHDNLYNEGGEGYNPHR